MTRNSMNQGGPGGGDLTPPAVVASPTSAYAQALDREVFRRAFRAALTQRDEGRGASVEALTAAGV